MRYLGLLLVLLGWIVQLLSSRKKNPFHLFFLFALVAGEGFQIIAEYVLGNFLDASMHVLILCVIAMSAFRFQPTTHFRS